MGVLVGRSPLPETVLNVYSAFQKGSLKFYLGGGGGGEVSWACSGDNKVSLGFQSCGWLLGCPMFGEMEGTQYFKTTSLFPSAP